MTRIRRRWRDFRVHAVVFLLAGLAYAPGFWWGTPHATAEDRRKAWGVDDEPPLGPLAQLHDMTTPGLAPDANLGYPMMHPYLVLGLYAPYLGFLYATGGLSSPSGSYPYGFTDPVTALRHLSALAHFLSVLLGAGIVLAAYVIGRTLWSERDGRWAAAAALLSYPMFYYSRTSNVDVPALFFVAWSLVPVAQILSSGVTRRRLIVFGALAGLAIATKEPMAAAYVGLPVILLLPGGAWRGVRDPWALLSAIALTSITVLTTYAVGSGMVLDPTRWKAHIEFTFLRTAEVSQGSVSFLTPYPWTLDGHVGFVRLLLQRMMEVLTIPGLALAVTGIVTALIGPARRNAWLLLAAASYLVTLFVMVRTAQLRYVMPATFVLAIFAGHAAASLLGSVRRPARLAGGVLATAFVGIAVLWAVDLTVSMLRDSRYEAGRWIAAVARPGDRFEYFGAFQKNPPLPATVESGLAIEYLGGIVDAPRDDLTADRIRRGWRERQPRFIALIPDHTSRPGEPFPHSCPPQIFADLENGTLGYVRARLFESPPLFRFLRRPALDYGAVNPPVRLFVPAGDPAARPGAS